MHPVGSHSPSRTIPMYPTCYTNWYVAYVCMYQVDLNQNQARQCLPQAEERIQPIHPDTSPLAGGLTLHTTIVVSRSWVYSFVVLLPASQPASKASRKYVYSHLSLFIFQDPSIHSIFLVGSNNKKEFIPSGAHNIKRLR